ncbi:WxL domain-containing protein [Lactiplantibacillus daowaiensis]|uniref:WxL domain-containing protein n=1 Tax=Lactiplantibacillus daowaiensis TaxID=2559918 RepID=A0ABW1S0Q1_9LACO|nr:WxL domain-containing protein [Lactiplantibacillus daowaiensis]
MKFKTLVLGMTTLAMTSMLGGILTAQADDDVLGGNSVGEFSVAAGNLTIDAVPTFAFASTDVKTLTNGTTLNYDGSTLKAAGKTSTGTDLTVSDYRGANNAAWTLTSTISNFTNGSDTIAGTITYTTSGTASGTINAAGGTVWNDSDAKTGGTGSATAGTATTTSLTLPATTTAVSGNYDADITWTLNATASATD